MTRWWQDSNFGEASMHLSFLLHDAQGYVRIVRAALEGYCEKHQNEAADERDR